MAADVPSGIYSTLNFYLLTFDKAYFARLADRSAGIVRADTAPTTALR